MADTKNYGLKGVGDDVQFGKQGGRFVFNTGTSDFRATTDGTTLSHLQVLDPVSDTDAATKLYVDDVAAGLDPKESCEAASTADIGATYNSTGGSGTGSFTGVPVSIDGVTLAENDRVLLKNQTVPAENGIYVVLAATTTMNRASDSNTDAEVTAGNYTFITGGTVNQDSGWVLQGPDPLTVGTGGGSDMNWVLFSTSSDILAGDALTKTGNTLNLDFVTGGGLTNTVATAVGDFIAFSDTSVTDTMQLRSWTNVLADLDIVTIGANGMIVRTAADTYAARTITAAGAGNTAGAVITNGDGVSGNPTVGVDIQNTTALGVAVATGDSLLLWDTSLNVNNEVTVDQLKTFMNAGTSSTSITEGDSTLSIADAGAGILTTNIDGTNVITTVLATTTFQNGNDILLNTGSSLTITDLTNNRVLLAGTAGLVEDSANLTFDGSTLAITGAATVSTDLTVTESLYLIEQAAAGADTATRGQLWTRNDAPNTSMFTDDLGNDFVTNNIHETDYNYSSAVTTTDPGPGSLNFNSVTIGSIATLYIDDLDGVGKDYAWALDNLAVGDILTIRSASDPANYIIASVSTTPTDNTGWWTIPLTLIYTGTIFTNGDQLRITIEWQSQGVSAVPTLITVADSTNTTSFPTFFESATGNLGPKTDASNYTYNATTGALAATSFNGVALTTGGAATNFLDETGSYTALTSNATHTGQVTGSTALALHVTAVTAQPASGAIIATDTIIINDGGVLSEATFTQMDTYFDSSLGFVTASGTPLNNQVAVFTTGTDIDSTSTFTWDATTLVVNELSFAGDTISNNTADQPLILRPNGTGSIIFQNGSSEEILELLDIGSAVNGLSITPGITGTAGPQIGIGTGGEANVDIGFVTAGTGVLSVAGGAGTYEDNVTAPDDIPNKQYVDDAIQTVGGSGSLDSVTADISLAAPGTFAIGAATGIPANCTILSTIVDITTLTDTAVTVTVGDATNGVASYMLAAENDPEATGIYISDGRLLNGGTARQANAVVGGVDGTVGNATIIITFRHV